MFISESRRSVRAVMKYSGEWTSEGKLKGGAHTLLRVGETPWCSVNRTVHLYRSSIDLPKILTAVILTENQY